MQATVNSYRTAATCLHIHVLDASRLKAYEAMEQRLTAARHDCSDTSQSDQLTVMSTVPTPSSATVLVPLKLSAFALTPSTCATSNHYSIAPITQPNYTFLRLHDNLIVPDILDQVDLHQVSPANLNSRLTDLGSGQPRQNRLGVYIHWTLPPVYRSGSAAAPTASGQSDPVQASRKLSQGFPGSSAANPSFGAATDYTAPDFRPVPNRWLIIRHINQGSVVPANTSVPEFQSWVVESDSLRNINDKDLQAADLEVDVSPSTNPLLFNPTDNSVVEGQAEAFVGKCTSTDAWNEEDASKGKHINLTVMTSSNPLFADYQPHNNNVFSFLDNFSYTTSGGSKAYLSKALCDYFVVGWHSRDSDDPFTTDASVPAPAHSSRLSDCQMALKNGGSASAIAWLNANTATRVLCHATMYDVAYDTAKVPDRVQADIAGQLLQSKQSIAVGVSPLDALMAYCRAHEDVDDAALGTLEKDLLRIQSLLIAGDSDDVDALQAAADESYEQAFSKINGGTLWHFHQESDPSATPSAQDLATMRTLNRNQTTYDNAAREVANQRWQLFAQWWLYVSGYGQSLGSAAYKANITKTAQRLSDLTSASGRQAELSKTMQSATAALSNASGSQQPQQGTGERFYQRSDPTILFGNIRAGFEDDFNDATQVRLQDQGTQLVPDQARLISTELRTRYGFDEDISQNYIVDDRAVSGRVVLAPQAATALSKTLQSIFQNTNADDLTNSYGMPPTEQSNLMSNLSKLDFASSGLVGLTADLLTLQQGGQHVKPAVRLTNSAPVVVKAATQAASAIGFTDALIQSMDIETSLTPYGSSVAMDADTPPMKLVTHGQLMFTKLNVIDKFGQAISAINPAPVNYGAPVPSISPCLSDTYFPGTIGGVNPSLSNARANCVLPQADHASCPFINLPPGINQPARLNAEFVNKVNGAWSVCSEWDVSPDTNPIWGWIVVNFAEQGLQIFLADGTFYREVRFGGQTGAQTTAKWLPYEPPLTLPSTTQIDFLIQKLGDTTYLSGFVDMVLQSTLKNQVAAPDSYAAFSSAIIGKPLALVNIGYSLELAGAENQNWSTVNTKAPDLHLLQPDGTSFAPNAPGGYTFPIKLGDRDRTFDGLVGYFPSAAPHSNAAIAPASSSDLDLSSLYTYYPSSASSPPVGDPRIFPSAQNNNFPLFTPYFNSAGKAGDPIVDQVSKMQIFGAIMDPFLPIHAYSVILPNKSLKLPDWMVEKALGSINAFWRIGPLLVTDDMPQQYDVTRALDPDAVGLNVASPGPAAASSADDPMQALPKVSLPLPAPAASASGSNAAYRYLQPYLVPLTDPGTGALISNKTEYNVFGISGDAAGGGDAANARLPDGPYTAIEGYAQIVQKA
ncbi:MAG: hypothetical protein Q9168_003377 [Polycauliona sp. 1 TL-2023]